MARRKSYVLKAAILESTKSNLVKGWISEYNKGVPCRILRPTERDKLGRVEIEIGIPHDSNECFRLWVRSETVTTGHKLFKHNIPLSLLSEANAFKDKLTQLEKENDERYGRHKGEK